MSRLPMADRLARVASEELGTVHLAHRAVLGLIGLLPTIAFIRLRTRLMALCGWNIAADAAIFGVPRLYGHRRPRRHLVIGPRSAMNVDCTIELNDDVTIGADVAIGHGVMILTSSHRLGGRSRRAGPYTTAPVVIGDGAWIGSKCIILPGVTIEPGSVVMAGSTVNTDVAENTLVAGVPATVLVPRLPG